MDSTLISVAARSKVWVCNCSLVESAGANPAGGMNPSSREVLPSVVSLRSGHLDNKEVLAHKGMLHNVMESIV